MNPNIKRKTITYDHTRELSEEAKAGLMDKVSRLEKDKYLAEIEKQETAKDFGIQIKALEKEIHELCEQNRTGQENITITAYEVWDYEKGEIRIEHTGTGEVLERRDMTEKERQQELFQDEPAPDFRPSCLNHGPDNYPVRNYQAGPRGELASFPRPNPEKYPDLDRSYTEEVTITCEHCGAEDIISPEGELPEGWETIHDHAGTVLYCADCIREAEEAGTLQVVYACDGCGVETYLGPHGEPPNGWQMLDKETHNELYCPKCISEGKHKVSPRSPSWRHRLEQMIINAVNEGKIVDGYPDPEYVRSVFGWPSGMEEPTEAEVREAFVWVREELKEKGKEAA